MACHEESDNHWTYDDPSKWSKRFPAAAGLCQSPININTYETVTELFPAFEFSSKYDSKELFKLTNNGHQVAVTLADRMCGQTDKDLWVSGGGLEGKLYFVNFHLHWGFDDRDGSEHEFNGQKYPAEAHVVFKNDKTGQMAVFGFLFSVTDDPARENLEWKKYTHAASELTKINDTIQCTFSLKELMQANETQFFRYTGSLTTPPCTEGVIWTLFASAIPIKEEDLNILRQNVMKKIYRPIQPTNDRTILRNFENIEYSFSQHLLSQ